MKGRVIKIGKAAVKGQRRKRVKRGTAINRARQRAPTVAALQKQLSETQQQQAATSEVLNIIARSKGKLEPVFQSILKNAIRLCEAGFGNLLLVDGQTVRWGAGMGTPPKLARHLQSPSFRPAPGSHLERVMRTRQVSHSADDRAEPIVGASARLGGARSTLCVPMIKDGVFIGAIFMYRTEVRPFTESQINLVKTFAAQAVIAIQNTRLFNETREALERQTATADILKVIASSPSDTRPVFDAIATSANRLLGGFSATVFLFIDGMAHLGASFQRG